MIVYQNEISPDRIEEIERPLKDLEMELDGFHFNIEKVDLKKLHCILDKILKKPKKDKI